MTVAEIAYVAFILSVFGSFGALLAFVSWDEKRRQKRLGLHWYRRANGP